MAAALTIFSNEVCQNQSATTETLTSNDTFVAKQTSMIKWMVKIGLLLMYLPLWAQTPKGTAQPLARPKLVVGIVVDQMRWDFLYRYYNRYGSNGFKRLMNDGFSCDNTFIPYLPTYTAPGHTCIYTGSVPALHGIIGNNWYERSKKRTVYCTDDDTAQSVGSNSPAGKMSPANLWSSTVTDELRIATNFSSKVIGIALKDRGAILPAGHAANAAYWFDNANGTFISSTYYMRQLPAWLTKFNEQKLADKYLRMNWNTLYPQQTYLQSTTDDKAYEGDLPGEDHQFPHKTDSLAKDKYNLLRFLPWGNTLTADMAKAAIAGEKLGQNGQTDFIAISFSSTDYMGHTFGPNSMEAEDMYLRLDKELGDLLTYLDASVGKGQYTVFLSADHGAAHVPGFASSEARLPAGNVSATALKDMLNDSLEMLFGKKRLVENVINEQVYFAAAPDSNKAAIKSAAMKILLGMPSVANVVDLTEVSNASLVAAQKNMLINGYNQRLSGDVQFLFKPQWMEGGSRGTTHGAWNPYDAHIPLLWFGWGINKGKTSREVYMTDIAATVAALLHIQMPNACVGKVITEAIK